MIPLPSGFKPANEPDTVLQKTIPRKDLAASISSTIGLNFEGLGIGFPNYTINVAPPDTEGAVGLTQYVQWVNLSFAVFDKTTGNVIFGPVAGNTLWANFGGGCETENDGDPVVTYDKLANRWVFSQFVVKSQPFLQCVAVSTTSDATGTYNRYSFEYSNFDDYPKMGVWPDAYYETFNMFVGNTFVGADACAYDRNAMLNGQPATQICFQQAATVGGMLPADLDGRIAPPPGSPNYLMVFDVNSLDLYKFHVDFVTPSNSTFTGPINIPVAPFTPFCPSVHGCVPQPGGDGTNLDSLGDRLMYRLAYRNFGDHESLVVNHSVVADPVNQNSGVRWYEIRNPNGATPPVVAQQSTFAPDSGFRWMGSAAMDASGNLAVGYTVLDNASVPPLFASGAIAARSALDPPNQLQAETVIASGTGTQTSGLTRWGDYSAMQVDPVDDCTFWYTTEYLTKTGSFDWNTRVANFKFPGCGAIALSIAKSHTGNFTQGQTGATYSLTVTNVGAKATDGTAVTVTDTLPAGLTPTAITSTDPLWVCTLGTLSCTRSDVLASGTSYPPITVTVNVAANAAGSVTNTATVTGGGSKDTTGGTANDVTTVIVTGPDPAIAMTNVPLVQGQTATYTITVTNRGLTATNGTALTVSDTLPAGLTATAISSTDATWVCTLGTLSCTRSDVLASGNSYAPITLSVSVTAPMLTVVANTASVAGGGDVNLLNNTVTDAATVLATPPGLSFASPTLPSVPSIASEFKPGTKIAITGTATGVSFQSFSLQWAEGINPSTGFSSAGITPAGGGSAPITNGPLGTWDTTGITQADYYTVRLTVNDAGFSNFAQTFVYLEPSLISQNWPIGLVNAPEFYSGFQSLADASGNQKLILVEPGTLFSQGSFLTFSPDGSSHTSTEVFGPTVLNPAVGQMDTFPGGDGVVPNRNTTADQTAQVQLFHSDNSSSAIALPLSLNPILFNTFTFSFQVPVLEAVGGTGQLDFVSLAAFIPGANGTDHAFLLSLRPDGSLLSGNFPVVIPDQNPNIVLTLKPRVLVGDLHGDGSKEFVVIAGTSASTFTLLQFTHDGTPIPWAVPQFSGLPAAMILADLDHNGMLETILTVAQGSPSGEDSLTMHVFQPDGTERPGWPVSLGFVNPDDFTFSQLAVGDLNRDGVEEIIEEHHNGTVNILEPDGTAFPGFSMPALSGHLGGSLALADIDGDGLPEILVDEYQIPTFAGSPATSSAAASTGRTATVHGTISPQGVVTRAVSTTVPESEQGTSYFALFLLAIRQDGTVARTWTLQGVNASEPLSNPTITVGDFNNDQLTDIALNYPTVTGGIGGSLGEGTAVVLTTGTPFNAAVNDWPMVFQNPRNTAVLRRAVTVALSSPVGGGSVAGTVPITAATTGNMASVQFKIDGVNFGASVTAAPFTLPWDTTQAATGTHQLIAVATDSNGRPVASAPLTVNVIRGSGSTVTLALTAGTSPSTFGDSLTFTATVAPNTATGSVTFFDGATPISGAVSLSGGSASFTTSLVNAGTRNITARYSGDSAVGGSISAVLTQTVQPAPLTITANPSTSVYGSAPTFSGSVSATKNGDVLTIHFSTTATLASPPGNYVVTPSITGLDVPNYAVATVNGTLTITPAPLTVTAGNSSRLFGVDNPQFFVTLAGAVNGDGFTFGASSSATAGSPVGQYPIVPFVSGPNISSYTVQSVNGTLTVTQAGSTMALATSSASVTFGAPVTFTATVFSATSGVPTGSVQILDSTGTLGTAPLNAQGVAVLTTSSLSVGSHSITAHYSGDSNFTSSLSPAISEQVTSLPGTPDFSIVASPSTATVKAGGSATFSFTVTPVNGFNQTVNFSCAGLPALAECSFAPPSLTPNGSPVTSTLTVTTTAPSVAFAPAPHTPSVPRTNLPLYASLFGTTVGLAGLAFGRRRKESPKLVRLWLGLAGLCTLAILTSCGGGGGSVSPPPPQGGTPSGTSQVTVTVSAGTSSKTATVTLVVQ